MLQQLHNTFFGKQFKKIALRNIEEEIPMTFSINSYPSNSSS